MSDIPYGVAYKVGPSASIEFLDSYEENLDFYDKNNYTYVPMPFDGVYFDTENKEIKEIEHQQYIREDATTRHVIEHLREYPFLLVEIAVNVGITEQNKVKINPPKYDKEGTEVYNSTTEAANDRPDLADKLAEMYEKDDFCEIHIITLADVNRRRIKDDIYSTIAELEMRLAEEISNNNLQIKDIYPDLKKETIGRWKKDDFENSQIPIQEYMNLSEMLKVIGKREPLREEFGFSSRNKFDEALGGLVNLRNKVMHSSRTLVRNKSGLNKLIDRLSRAEETIEYHGASIDKYRYEQIYPPE